MKYIYQSIANILEHDSILINLVGYTAAKMNIRRGFQLGSGWQKLIAYYFQPDFPITDFTPNIREIPLIVRVYDRDDDLNCGVIGERVIVLLDGANLSVAGQVHVYDISYTGELVPVTFNEELKSYERVLRFILQIRKDA